MDPITISIILAIIRLLIQSGAAKAIWEWFQGLFSKMDLTPPAGFKMMAAEVPVQFVIEDKVKSVFNSLKERFRWKPVRVAILKKFEKFAMARIGDIRAVMLHAADPVANPMPACGLKPDEVDFFTLKGLTAEHTEEMNSLSA